MDKKEIRISHPGDPQLKKKSTSILFICCVVIIKIVLIVLTSIIDWSNQVLYWVWILFYFSGGGCAGILPLDFTGRRNTKVPTIFAHGGIY